MIWMDLKHWLLVVECQRVMDENINGWTLCNGKMLEWVHDAVLLVEWHLSLASQCTKNYLFDNFNLARGMLNEITNRIHPSLQSSLSSVIALTKLLSPLVLKVYFKLSFVFLMFWFVSILVSEGVN